MVFPLLYLYVDRQHMCNISGVMSKSHQTPGARCSIHPLTLDRCTDHAFLTHSNMMINGEHAVICYLHTYFTQCQKRAMKRSAN